MKIELSIQIMLLMLWSAFSCTNPIRGTSDTTRTSSLRTAERLQFTRGMRSFGEWRDRCTCRSRMYSGSFSMHDYTLHAARTTEETHSRAYNENRWKVYETSFSYWESAAFHPLLLYGTSWSAGYMDQQWWLPEQIYKFLGKTIFLNCYLPPFCTQRSIHGSKETNRQLWWPR